MGALVIAICWVAASAQAAAPAWKLQAITTPTNIPPEQSAVQRLTVEAEGGSFGFKNGGGTSRGVPVVTQGVLTYAAGSPTATIDSVEGADGFEIGSRLTAPGTYEPGKETTVVSCSPDCVTPGSEVVLSSAAEATAVGVQVEIFTKKIANVQGQFPIGSEVSNANAHGFEYLVPGTTVVAQEGETLTLSRPTGYEYLSFEALLFAFSTPISVGEPVPFNASAREVEKGVEELAAFGSGAVSVSGGPGGDGDHPYFIEFTGPFADRPIPTLTVVSTKLEGLQGHAYARVTGTVPGGAGTGDIEVLPVNIGGAPTSGESTITVGPLPSGVATTGTAHGEGWTCTGGAGELFAACHLEENLGAMAVTEPLFVPVEVTGHSSYSASVPVKVVGGGAGEATTTAQIVVSPRQATPGVQAMWAGVFDSNGRPFTQAGGHPFSAMTMFQLNTVRSPTGQLWLDPVGDLKEVNVDLPPGFIGDPLVSPRCAQGQLLPPATDGSKLCDASAKVGVISPFLHAPGSTFQAQELYNAVPAPGAAAQFTTMLLTPIQTLIASVRAEEGFGVRVAALQNPNYSTIFGAFTVLNGSPPGAGGQSFLANPTDCVQQTEEAAQGRGPSTRVSMTTYQEPRVIGTASDSVPVLTGCRALTEAWLGHGPVPPNEEPSFSFRPTTTQASSPTGATADIRVPQDGLTDPTKLRTSDLKKTVVTVPQGITVNPASANGLQACSEDEIGYIGSDFPSPSPIRFDERPVACPDRSKLGTVQIKSPLLEEELEGTVYLAAQEENPFHSLIALYIAIESERFGLNLKLAGEVKPDPSSGQLTVTFDDNPQLPFEEFTLHFRGGGPHATLATPETCGHFTASGSLEPWSAESGEALSITEAGFSTSGACADSDATRPFAPSFEAGTTGTQAGSYSPLVVKVDRKDGEQELKSIDFTLPKGLTGKLAGIPYCPEASIREAEGKTGRAEEGSASCPAASQIGVVDTSAGVGSEPIHVDGKVYLAGPYKGAPLSSVVVTPAVAGPFDLGDVVIRAPLYVDPETAQITAKSDPIPTILRGIPLKVRSVAIYVNRSDFSLNPTNCEPMAATASMTGSSGATATPSNRFQVSGCKNLKFKPSLKISLAGSTKRTGHPALKAVVTYPKSGSYANIARAQVNLPHTEFLDQGNLNKTCTRPVLLEGKCPAKSIYGRAIAWTPLFEKPLEGPVYVVGGYGYKLPALVADLNGQIRVTLVGKVDSGPNRGIRNSFEAVPDAPVSRFVLKMKGGKKYGLLENSENLCNRPQRAVANFTAQNGSMEQIKPLIGNQCGKKSGNGGAKKRPSPNGKH